MADLSMDTTRVNLVNNLDKDLFVYTQFEECYKCPYFDPFQVSSESNETQEFTTHFTLMFAVTDGSHYINSTKLCSGIIHALDQSIHNLIIGENNNCTIVTVEEGRNNLFPALFAFAILLVLTIAFYTGRFIYYRRNKSNDDKNEELNNKLSQRLNSLDAFRGLTILCMIFVNWGSGGYHTLEHVEWNGIRFADFIFPSFIFIMGTTMAISLKNLVIKKNIPLQSIYLNVVWRAIKLFFLGLVINSKGSGHGDIRHLRIPGVLQRFSISYLVVASVHIFSLHINREKLYSRVSFMNDILPYWPDWILAGVMSVVYFCVTFLWEFDPNCPRGYLGPGGFSENASYPHCVGGAAGKLDDLVFGQNHIYDDFFGAPLYDPEINKHKKFGLRQECEGLLGFTTSIVLTLIGLQIGKIIVTYSASTQRLARWILWALLLSTVTAILAGTGTVPINKNLWSYSFICVTGATAIVIFSLFYLLIDHFKVWPCGHPFHYPGMNSILLYIGHEFTENVFPFFYMDDDSSHVWPLAQDITGVLMWLLISVYLAKKNFFLAL